MTNFTSISTNELGDNLFRMLSEDWALVTAGTYSDFNTMTVSWGGFGVLWNKNVATIYIRPQRYTREFIETNELFTISVLPDSFKSALTICGRKSGRDCNKVEEAGITPVDFDGCVAFKEARLVLVCKKLYHSDIDPAAFYDSQIDKNYPQKDYHRMYIGEIVSVFTV